MCNIISLPCETSFELKPVICFRFKKAVVKAIVESTERGTTINIKNIENDQECSFVLDSENPHIPDFVHKIENKEVFEIKFAVRRRDSAVAMMVKSIPPDIDKSYIKCGHE